MATLWMKTDAGYVASPLPIGPGDAAEADAGDAGPNGLCSEFRIVAFRDGTRPRHAMIAATGIPVRVNGAFIVGGLRVLRHQDELIVGSQQIFFSAESAPLVEVYRHDDSQRQPRCPICRAEIRDGHSIVRCPGCSRRYHQIDATDDAPAKPCWTYSPVCRFCEHPTSMSGEPTWRPDENEQ